MPGKLYTITVALFGIAFLLSSPAIHAQRRPKPPKVLSPEEAKMVKKDAATLFALDEYNGALKAYLDLYKTDPKNSEFNLKIGYCYLMTNIDKSAALKYYEAGTAGKEIKKENLFYLGLSHLYNLHFDEAIKYFQDFKLASGTKPLKDQLPPDRLIEMCKNGKELVAKPVNVSFTNLGKNINSPTEDYNPYISADNTQIYFSSRRKGNVGGVMDDFGTFTADVYNAFWRDTVWTKAKGLGGLINTEGDEESVGLSASADQLVLYFENMDAVGDLALSKLRGKAWQKPLLFPEAINSKQYEGGACMNLDGSVIYFSSSRKDGQGGTDIWMVKKESNESWSTPVNLGTTINSKYDEEGPFLSMNGKTLYFVSKGFNSMGGFDIFKSVWDEQNGKWGAAQNLGYPINDPDDNLSFSLSGDERFAYVGMTRTGGIGDRDIWQVEFKDTTDHPFRTVIKGSIATSPISKIELTKVTLENKSSHEILTYKPGYGNSFVLSAAPGDYILKIEGYNFSTYTEEFTVGNEYPPVKLVKSITVNTAK